MQTHILGIPLWRGKIKRRVAKKYCRNYKKWFLHHPDMENLGIGDFVNNCSGYNVRIARLEPWYRSIGSGKGQVLIDIDITSDTGGQCSLMSCGVCSALSQAEVEKEIVEFHRDWTLANGGACWFEKGSDNYIRAVERANQVIQIIESGGHITDQYGQQLPEYRVIL